MAMTGGCAALCFVSIAAAFAAAISVPRVVAADHQPLAVHGSLGPVREWVEDLGGMLVAADNRQQGDPELTRFCGTGALTMEQKENYATLMRIAMLSNMQASYTSATMGFRCAEEGVSKP
jgi:formylglycine-generating enzyme